MNRRLKYIAALSVLICSCHKPDIPQAAPSLSFSVTAGEAFSTRSAGDGSTPTTDANLKTNSFGVFGVYTDTHGAASGSNVFLTSGAKEVVYDTKLDSEGKAIGWTYSPLQYWTLNKFYRFRAYHPYSGNAIRLLSDDSSADRIVIEYASAAGQEDLLVGFKQVESSVDNLKNEPRVKIPFVHALCALEFRIAYKNSADIPDESTDRITSFYITDIIPTGTLIYTHPGDYIGTPVLDWNASYYDDNTYFNWSGSKEFGKYEVYSPSYKGTEIFDGTDHLVFCVPQTCSSSAEHMTVVHFKTELAEAENSAVLEKLTWEPGKIYTYTLLVSQSDLEIQITIKDWTVIQSNEDMYL